MEKCSSFFIKEPIKKQIRKAIKSELRRKEKKKSFLLLRPTVSVVPIPPHTDREEREEKSK